MMTMITLIAVAAASLLMLGYASFLLWSRDTREGKGFWGWWGKNLEDWEIILWSGPIGWALAFWGTVYNDLTMYRKVQELKEKDFRLHREVELRYINMYCKAQAPSTLRSAHEKARVEKWLRDQRKVDPSQELPGDFGWEFPDPIFNLEDAGYGRV